MLVVTANPCDLEKWVDPDSCPLAFGKDLDHQVWMDEIRKELAMRLDWEKVRLPGPLSLCAVA